MNKLILFLWLLFPLLCFAQDKQEKGVTPQMQQFSKTLESEFNALKTAEGRRDTAGMARSCGNLGGTYLNIAKLPQDDLRQADSISADENVDLERSVRYLNKGIRFAEVTGDINLLKKLYKNLSAAQKMSGDLKGALASYKKMLALKHTILDPSKALELEHRHLDYQYGKRVDSIMTTKQMEQKQLVSKFGKKEDSLISSKQVAEKNLTEKQKELETTSKSLQITQQEKACQASDIALQQSKLELQQSQLELQQSKLQLQKNELEKKDRNIEQHKAARKFYILGIIALFVISVLAYRTNWVQRRFTKALMAEKQRSEDLLLNILPAEVAGELKEKGFADAKLFTDVTVIFTDFVSFTSAAENMDPQQLVGELHICFKAFDEITGRYQIEKIKTIGDAYMAVSGLPAPNPGHAFNVIAAALEIREFMRKRKAALGAGTFNIRIGVSSGGVIAGIVGARKYSYDIWGDTVNVAARMEQNCEEGKINISDTTYQLVKDKYACAYRGKIEAKNKGSIDMYYLERK